MAVVTNGVMSPNRPMIRKEPMPLGVFVTTSAFSSQAIDFVRHLTQRVILIDGQRLADLLIEHNVGVLVGRRVEFKRIDENFFSEDD
jgi:restriction system protein